MSSYDGAMTSTFFVARLRGAGFFTTAFSVSFGIAVPLSRGSLRHLVVWCRAANSSLELEAQAAERVDARVADGEEARQGEKGGQHLRALDLELGADDG